MKAMVCTVYGLPDVLQLEELAKPIPRDNEVLVEVHAASVNSWDWDILRGTPFMNRLGGGLRQPKYKILGADVAGRVEAVGSAVKQFQPGDEVFGDLSGCGWGGFAEYVCARENALVRKPDVMTYEEAAAIPQAAAMALEGLRDVGNIQLGHRVLVNGAGGGVGTFAVQIAKSFGAEVTGVDSAAKLEMIHSIGADHVIDYTQEDFAENGKQYDLILDMVAHRSLLDIKRSLSPRGIFVMVGAPVGRLFQAIFLGPLISMTGSRKMRILLAQPNSNLIEIIKLIEAGVVRPVVDRCYPLNEVPEALQYIGDGHVQGKVVITINQ
jgi:NADPH:quinone reductase-like Zn-dependent oxidoreductase